MKSIPCPGFAGFENSSLFSLGLLEGSVTAWWNCCGVARGWQLSESSKSYLLFIQDYLAFKRTISIHVQGIWTDKRQRLLSKEVFGGTTGKVWGGDKTWLYCWREKNPPKHKYRIKCSSLNSGDASWTIRDNYWTIFSLVTLGNEAWMIIVPVSPT